ncbi:MAG: ABC transporter permease [Acidimicrobiales bacterium]
MNPGPPRGRHVGAFAGATAVAGVNVRRLLGDRRLVVVATIVPVVLIFVTGLLTGGTKVPVGVVNRGSGSADTRLLSLLARADGLKIRIEPSAGALNDDILRSRVVAGVEIPADFGTGSDLAVTFVGEEDQTQAVQAHTAVVATLDILAAENQAGRSASGGSTPAGVTGPAAARTAGAARAAASSDAALARVTAGARPPLSPFSYVGPADLVLFAGVTLLVMASGLVESRRLGLLRRMLVAPVRPTAVVAGHVGGLLVTAVGQAIGLLLVGRLLFGVRWGDPLGVIMVVLGLSLALSCGSVLLGTLARSPEQAVALAVVLAIAGGMLGGCLWPLSVVGPVMAAAGHATPQAWAMDGLVSLVYDRSGLLGVLPDVAALFGFTALLGSLAAWRLRVVLLSAPDT